MEYCICQRGPQQYYPSSMLLDNVTLSLFPVSGGVLSSWTWVDLLMALANRRVWWWCVSVASEPDGKVPCSVYLPYLECLLSEPNHQAEKEAKLAHDKRPHGKVTPMVPKDSPAGVPTDSQHQLPIMWRKCLQLRGRQRFSVKGQTVNIFGFAGHSVSVVTTQLCHYYSKTAIDNT